MTERRSARTGDKIMMKHLPLEKNEERENKSGISRLVNEAPVTTREETLPKISPTSAGRTQITHHLTDQASRAPVSEAARRILIWQSKVDILINSTLELGKILPRHRSDVAQVQPVYCLALHTTSCYICIHQVISVYPRERVSGRIRWCL